MRTLIAAAAAVLLAGCNTVMSHKEMIESGQRSVHAVARPPADVAPCMARNAEVHHQLVASTRAADPPGAHEVLVRTGMTNILAYALAEPAGTGSRVTIWVDAAPFWRKSEIVGSMLKDCG
jgi:hypothetical protein